MIAGGVRLGRVFGIPVRVDWSVLAILALVTWGLSSEISPELAAGYSSAEKGADDGRQRW
jgi:hypothetical protein